MADGTGIIISSKPMRIMPPAIPNTPDKKDVARTANANNNSIAILTNIPTAQR
jgi:hypothetical protein